jgi:hypothetical protein
MDSATASALALWAYDQPNGKALLKSALDDAAKAFLDGDSGAEASVSVAGKTFTFSDSMSLQDRIATLRKAYNDLLVALGEEVVNRQDVAHQVTFQIEH